MNLLHEIGVARAFSRYGGYREQHSADDTCYIKTASRGHRIDANRHSITWPHWEVWWRDEHMATCFRREDACIYIRSLKVL